MRGKYRYLQESVMKDVMENNEQAKQLLKDIGVNDEELAQKCIDLLVWYDQLMKKDE